jgi:hypothetical protein
VSDIESRLEKMVIKRNRYGAVSVQCSASSSEKEIVDQSAPRYILNASE